MSKEAKHAENNAKESFKELELIIKTAKDITIKFIEVGKISPSSFPEVFGNIFQTVQKAINSKGK